MWTHASDAALMDVLDGTASDRILSHVSGCERCRARVEEARAAMTLAVGAAAPEPAPIYWEAMRRQVARGLAGPSRPRFRRPLWAAAAVAGAAMAALVAVRPGPTPVEPSPAATTAALPAWSPLPPADEDPGLPVLEQVAPMVVAASPALECGDVAECVTGLDDEESRALTEILREEMGEGRAL
jgi:hypothetical protein